ncbi:efflux RND transporter permease subunit [Neoroseomonas oryzicola]|uniref:Efflux RND transporter permease subunit n=1 Tax=Neoroseomonas oryzicola TaxID=535904 RepID=A0A9X9WGA2_9PROT|nr:efflux RND transporter permease subunit [Neoroseomonas oryzicola]MBR0659362.1 efflux RND transporter permease subunit [Neoroseomonas oryzicola]NKE16263.1 efflux RND transporter permease subunit [Neoroseomonas oryzicola]
MGFNLSDWGVRNGALTLFLIVMLGAAGAMAYLRLGRAEDPGFTIKVMVVTAQWPGATAEEMQRHVADPIESRLQDLPYLDRVETFTRPGQAAMTVVLRDTTPPREVQNLWYQVRKKVGDMRHMLPAGVIGPFFDDEYSDVWSAIYAVTGADNAELVRQAEALRARLLRVPGVDKVRIFGEQPQRIHVEVAHARLASLGLQPQAILDALARHNPVTPAGVVEGSATRLHLRVDGGFDGLAAVREVPVAANGRSLRLGDIAEVTRGFADPASSGIRQGGENAVLLAVAKQPGVNVLTLGHDLAAAMEAQRRVIPMGLTVTQIVDQAHVVQESIAEFLMKFVAALGVVMLVSFLSLGFRAGIIVALSVPLTLAIVFLVMLATGMELERVTLGALILSLGLLVDDAIIAIEAMVVKLEEGWSRAKAATFAWTSTAGPMLSGTLVTVAGFLPVGFARSTAGEYAGGIFWVVGIALVASWLVAVLFTPWLGVKLLPSPKPGSHHDAYDGRGYRALRRLVGWAVDHRLVVIGATLLVLVAGFAAMGQVRKQFFPTSARLELLVDINLRQGAGYAATLAAAQRIEQAIEGDPDARLVTTYLGQGSPRFFLALNPDLPNEAFAKIIVQARDVPARERLRDRLNALVADGLVPEARVRVSRLDFGPPVGFPVQFRIHGDDPAALRRAGEEVMAVMRATPGTRDVQLHWGERAPALRLELDRARVAELGLSPAQVASSLQLLLTGVTATQHREGNRLVDVVLRAPAAERLTTETLADLSLATPSGPVPLSQVARLVPEAEEPILYRRNREAYLTVRADVAPGLQGPDVSAAVRARLDPVIASLPVGLRIEAGGAAEESGKANAALFALFPVMIAVMLVLLMVQLRHFGRVALVLATAPLGIPGAAFALLALGAPFGFVALLGVIALAGMVMRNTQILVDQVRQDLEAGLDLRAAIVESTVRRTRPVLLTALAAVLAFIPLTLSVFWGPMAIAMIGGLTLATLATLLVVPALYALALPWRRASVVAGPAVLAPAE